MPDPSVSTRRTPTHDTLRRRFTSPLHDERIAAILGIALGVTFTVCFATGLWSHIQQHPPSWYIARPRPAGLYRVTQGVHIVTGLASIPLLLAKLWTVYPKLFAWPPFTSVAMLVERLALIPLIGSALFMLFTGLANINLWYPWPFNFPAAHYNAAWITIGALIIHIGAKLAATRRVLRRAPPDSRADDASTRGAPTSDRRVFLGTVFAGAVAVTLFTVGQTVAPLRKLALLAPRRPDTGPQGFPVNRTARGAGVVAAAQSPDYRLVVTGKVARELHLTRDDLLAMPQHDATLPISCVEGWSASRRWTGVPVRDIVARAGGGEGASVRVESLQRRRAYRTSMLTRHEAADRDALLALAVDGAPLHLDHGYPLRLIGPNRPGVLQTKWVTKLVVR
jgi:DMSO/TMAO reductase YedYZ molybdopterin-dependent catalytic subunit